jgi:hypothetical protein
MLAERVVPVCAGSDPCGDDDEDDYGAVRFGFSGRGYGYSDEDEDEYGEYDDSEDDYDLVGLRQSFRAVSGFGCRGLATERPTPRPWPRNIGPIDVPMAVLLPGDVDVKGGALEEKSVKEVMGQGFGVMAALLGFRRRVICGTPEA